MVCGILFEQMRNFFNVTFFFVSPGFNPGNDFKPKGISNPDLGTIAPVIGIKIDSKHFWKVGTPVTELF